MERERNELLRQELEVMRRERDVAHREAEIARRELALVTAGIPANPAPEQLNVRNFGNDLQRHPPQQPDAAPPALRADVKGIGELLGEFDGTNRYYEDW
ncbi:hypothetical protein KPH14_013021, partial [Odynerus spinipes]